MSTRIADLRLRPIDGPGLVGRLPGVAVLVVGADERAAAVIDTCELAAATAGADLAERLAALAEHGPLPPFAVLADTPAGLRVLAHEGVEVAFEAGTRAEVVTGAGGMVDQVRAEPFTLVRVGPAGPVAPVGPAGPVAPVGPGQADPQLDLAAGVVPAGAFVAGPDLATATAAFADQGRSATEDPTNVADPSAPADATTLADPSAPADPTTTGPIGAPAGSVVFVGSPPAADRREPLPLAGDPEPRALAKVVGIRCPEGHLNDPQATYCDQCGASLIHQTHNLVEGDRPALGFLVFDDGAIFVLDGDYVVGREPDDDPRVQAGDARALLLDDSARTVSRVHAEVRLDGWRVTLVDRGSTNGTYVWSTAAAGWQRLTAEVSIVLEPGQHASFGQRAFRFEPRRRSA